MTIPRARQILGEYAKDLKDSEIEQIITSFNGILEVGFRQFERKYQIEVNQITSKVLSQNDV
jgi:hypothetical protein